jgi:hypothetical protein
MRSEDEWNYETALYIIQPYLDKQVYVEPEITDFTEAMQVIQSYLLK